MKSLRLLTGIALFAVFLGCTSGTKELPPPTEKPKMTEDAKKQMEETIRKGKEMREKQGRRGN